MSGACGCASGVTCGDACCAAGQRCRDGACADPLPACIAPGEPCKDTGRPCCDGTVCASGQGGQADIACYAPAGAVCEQTDECVYGTECRNGVCVDAWQDWEIPDESCEPNVAPGDTAGILRALREEGEARLAPGEYVFELGEGETAIEMPESGGRIIGCRGAAALEDRQSRETNQSMENWKLVCKGKPGVSSWVCVRLPRLRGDWEWYERLAFFLVRVRLIGDGTTASTKSIGILDEQNSLHLFGLWFTLVSCFNRGLVQAQYSEPWHRDYQVRFCRNLDGTCFERVGTTLRPFAPIEACNAPDEACSCTQGGPCSPNVRADNIDDLLTNLAAGDAILPPNSTFDFTITSVGEAAIEIPAGLSTKLRACPGTDRSTVNIRCTEAQSQTPIYSWQCIRHQGASLTVENVTITGGNPDDGSTSGIFTTSSGGTPPGPLTVENTKITGFGNGLYNTGFSILTCAGNAICGNTSLNCRQPGPPPNDISASCSGCVAGNGTCPP